MKLINQMLIMVYAIASLYFLYLSVIGMFVYFANKSMEHYESFLIPVRNFSIGLLMAVIAWCAWFFINHPSYSKTGYAILYLPILIVGGFLKFMFINLLSFGGKWN